MLQSRQNQQAAGPETAAPGNDAPGVETVAPSSNAAALEALQAQGLDEEAPGGDVDGSAQGTGGQATAAPPGGGPPEDAWWVPFVRALSPEAAALLDKGVLGLAGEAIDGAVEGGLGSIDMAIDPEGWATEMQAALVGAIDMFSGVLAGDPTCCCMLEDACNAFMDGAQFLITNLSPGAAAFNALGGSIDAVLEAFGTILSLDGVQGVIDGIGSFVQDIIDEVAEWDEGAAAELAAWLGVGSDGGVIGTLVTWSSPTTKPAPNSMKPSALSSPATFWSSCDFVATSIARKPSSASRALVLHSRVGWGLKATRWRPSWSTPTRTRTRRTTAATPSMGTTSTPRWIRRSGAGKQRCRSSSCGW
jgi:hypothetical protein